MKNMAVESLLVGSGEAGKLCGVSRSTWWSLYAQGKTPASVKLGGKRLWRRDELVRWVASGCPSRDRWAAMEEAGKRVPRRA